MALIARSGQAPIDQFTDIFQHDITALDTPAAQRALHMGLLHAKREAMRSAEQLIRWGRPLLIGIITVSFLHLWDTIAAIRPAFVAELRVPAWLYYATAAALTLAIDAA